MKNKKIISIIMIIAVALCFTACDKPAPIEEDIQSNDSNSGDNYKIICADFPEYDWVRNILGENPSGISVELLNKTGSDMHSYQPSAQDFAQIADCDLLVYIGGVSEQWIRDAVKNGESGNSKSGERKVISLMDFFKKTETLHQNYVIEEHEGEDEHEHEHDEYDEHLWTSLIMAQTFVAYIEDSICLLDEENSDTYTANSSAYITKLADLNNKYKNAMDNSSKSTLVFADRFPFTYLIQDYDIDYVAAFTGCEAETEASFETVIKLANVIDEQTIKTILVIDGSNSNIATTVLESSKQGLANILTLDSMQSINEADIINGANYLGIMESNLAILEEALN